MIDYIQFNQETRQFSKFQAIKCLGGYKLSYNYTSKPAKELIRQVTATIYPYNYFNSIYSVSGDEKDKMTTQMNGLKAQCKEVPVVRAKRFNNACYIQDLDKISRSWIEADFEDLCAEWGMDLAEFKKAIGPHIVILGDRYACPPVLAHEFGHYLNTIGKGEAKGYKAHQQYGSAMQNANAVSNLSQLGTIGAAISARAGANIKTVGGVVGTSGIVRLSEIALSRPVIIAESCASQTALKNLAKVGATEEELNSYKKSLKEALGTYKWAYQYIPAIVGGIKTLAGGGMVYAGVKKNK
jgi:hypothetical protein